MAGGGDKRDGADDAGSTTSSPRDDSDVAHAATLPSHPSDSSDVALGQAPTEAIAVAAADDAEPSSVHVGQVLGERYEVLAELGRGGQGVVLRARDLRADTVVALKLLGRATTSPERLARFRRELQVARMVTHPSVVRIHDLVELPDRFALSMELVEGEALDFKLARAGKLSARDLVALAGDLARALEAAHEAGVVHRDLKPANVILRAGSGRAVVTDFGVSRLHGSLVEATTNRDAAAPVRGSSSSGGGRLTQEGALIGTPEYMAPEQLEGRTDIGPPVDVYAFGVLMFEAATGTRPHKAPTVRALSAARREVPAPPLASLRPDLPGGLCAVVDRCLAVDPAARYGDGAALRAAIEALAAQQEPAHGGRGPRSSRRFAIGAVALALAACVAAGFWGLRARRAAGHAAAAASSASSVASPVVFEPGAPERITFGEGCEEFPTFMPDSESIVFDATAGSEDAMYVMRLADRSRRPLAHSPGWDYAPAVSPDGTRIAFIRSSEHENGIFLTTLDAAPGTPARHIAAGNARPSWTPDGRSIWAGDLGHLVRYAADDLHEEEHLDAPQGVVSLRAFELPSRAVVELFPVLGPASQGGVAVRGPDSGAELRWLAHGPMSELFALTPGGRGVLVGQQTTTGEDELLTVPFDGSPPTSRRATGISARSGAAFSPDGRKLVYSTCRDVNVIGRVDDAGRMVPALGAGQWNDTDVIALPGGERVVVLSDRSGHVQPWVVDRTGREPPRALSLGRDGVPVTVAAAPDGKLLAIEIADKGIATLAVDGGASAEMLTEVPGDGQPAFGRDGREVLFTRTSAAGRPQVMAVSLATREVRPVLDEGTFAPAMSADGRIVYLAGEGPNKGSTAMLLDPRTGRRAPLSASIPHQIHGQPTFSADGSRVVLAMNRQTLGEVDVRSGKLVRKVTDSQSQISRVVYSGGELLVARALFIGDLWLAQGHFE